MASRKYHIGPSRIHGNGLIASRNLLPEDIIGPTHQNDKNHENKSWFYNHSKTPNARSVKVGNERYLIPSYRIKKGEEITIDYRFQPELEQPEDFNKGKISPKNVHDAADEAGIPWDNDESFMRFSKEVTGKEHIDKMTSKQRENLITNIKSLRSPVDSKNTHGYFNFNPAEGAVGAGLGANFSGGWGAEASGNTPLQANPYYKGSVGVKGSKQVGPWTFSGGVNKNLLGGFNPTFGAKYNFQDGGSLPKAQEGNGGTYYTSDPNDPRLQAYNDSSDVYNAYADLIKLLNDPSVINEFGIKLSPKRINKTYLPYFKEKLNDEYARNNSEINEKINPIGFRSYTRTDAKGTDEVRNPFWENIPIITDSRPGINPSGGHYSGQREIFPEYKKPTQPVKLNVEPKPHPGPVEVREERPKTKNSIQYTKRGPGLHQSEYKWWDDDGNEHFITPQRYNSLKTQGLEVLKQGGSLPTAQSGNGNNTYYTSDPNDPRFQAYADSSNAYNQGERYYEYIGGDRRGENTNIFSGSLSDFRDPEVNWSNSAGRNLVPTEYFGSSFRSATSVHEEDIAKDPESYPYRDKGMYIMAARFKKPTQEVRLSKMAVPVDVREERPATKKGSVWEQKGAPNAGSTYWTAADSSGGKRAIPKHEYERAQKFSPNTVLEPTNFYDYKYGGSLPRAQDGNMGFDFSNTGTKGEVTITQGKEDFQRKDFSGNLLSYGIEPAALMLGYLGDLSRYYAGQKLKDNILSESLYKPTVAKNKNAKYVAINDDRWKEWVLKYASDYPNKERITRTAGTGPKGQNWFEYALEDNALGNFDITRGKDKKGQYLSYYDIYDIYTGKKPNLDEPESLGAVKPYEIYDRIYYTEDPKTGKYTLQKRYGGSLPKAQSGGQSQVFTYENNPEWFDNQARYHDNQDYSNIIKEKVYAGTHGYNPSTGALHKLDVPVHIPPATQEMATEEWGRKSHQERFESPTPAGKSVRKGHVGRSMQDVFENPITYVPGAVASLPYMAGMGAAAYPTAARYGSLLFNSPLSMAGRTLGPTIPTIAGSTSPVWTAGNMVGAGFIGHGLTNIVPDTKDLIKDPSLAGALDVGVDLLETSPLWIPPVIRGVNALRQLPAPSFSSVLPSKGYTPPRIIDDLIPKPAYVVPQYGGSSSQSSRSNEQLIKEIEAMQSYFLKGRGKTKSVADTDDLLMDLAKEQGLRKELIKTTSQSKVSNIQKQLGEHREVVNKKLYEGTYGDASITGSYEGNLKGIETLFKQKMNEGYMHEMNLAINKNTADFARMEKIGNQYPFFTRYDRTKPFQLSKHPDDIFNLRKNLYEYGPLSPNNLPEVLAERKIIIDQDLHMTYEKNKFHSKMERLRDQVGAGFDNVVPMTPGSNIARNFPRSNYAMKQADKIQKEYIQALQADASARTGPFGGPRSDMLSPTKTSFFDEGIENLRWSLDRNVPHPGPLYQHRTPIKGTQNWSNFIDDHSFFLGSGATSRNASGQLGSRVINTHITPLESPGLEGPSRYIWPDNPLFFGGLNQQGGELPYAQQGGVPTYQSQLDYESLNRFDVDYNTFKGGKSVILPKKVGIDRLHTRDRAEEIFAGLATKFPDANKIYSPGQLEESGFAEEYYDLYKYTKMYKDTMNKYNSTAGQDEFGQGDTTPLKEQQIGRLHEDFFTKGMGPRRVASSEEAAHIALLKSENRLQQGGSIPSYQGASDAPQMQDIYKTGNFPKPQEIKQESPIEETQAATIDLNNLDMDEALIVYRDYIEGIYDGTPDELIAEKVYDKLNRIFYKKAKEQGMSAPNYIMSTIKG